MEIVGEVKNYEWGQIGSDSEVAQLIQLNSPSFSPGFTPYAELWLGDHPSGPSKVKATGELLGTAISKNPAGLIGGMDSLPFLLKVLSIRKALSIQVHPDKKEAEKLHNSRPDVYKDPNHKPELAIALTPFLALCGFRPYEEIFQLCSKFKPLKDLLEEENISRLNSSEGLKKCYNVLMNTPQDKIDVCIDKIINDYGKDLKENHLFEIFHTINLDFTNDVGLLSLFFFNIIRLEPGQAIFLPANEPHAYLRGDVVECMACSDNVIRAGLTPKYKDVSTLLRLINYEGLPSEKKIFNSIKKDPFLELFIPDIKDFAVAKLSLPNSKDCYEWENRKYGCILLVLQGKRKLQTNNYGTLHLMRGSSVFIPSDCKTMSFIASNCPEDFVGYIAMYNDF